MSYRSMFRADAFTGQVIIVTGGGSGLGRCAAHELASLGAHVALVGRKEDKLLAAAAEITEDGGRASTHVTDIRDEAGVVRVVDQVLADHGRIDGLVNNAGGQFSAPLADISLKGFEAVVRSNLTGGFVFMREVYNRWMRDHGGSIVNITADFWNGMPAFGHSGAARAGMTNLTETAAAEWAHRGVRVNSVAPGYVATSGFDTYPEEVFSEMRKIAARVPMGRFGNEAEVSAAIVFLLSPAASYITGSYLRIDGGSANAKVTMTARAPEPGTTPFDGFHRAKPTRQ